MKTRRTWRNQANHPESGNGALLGRVLAGVARALRGRAGWAAGASAVLVLGLVGVWLFVGSGQDGPPDPRARQYKEFDACLLTDEKGIVAGAAAAPVWEGMQKASLETRARVTYVPVIGEPSAANARPFFNSLMQRKCDVVLAVGAPRWRSRKRGRGSTNRHASSWSTVRHLPGMSPLRSPVTGLRRPWRKRSGRPSKPRVRNGQASVPRVG